MQHLVNLVERYENGELLLSFFVMLELMEWATVHIEKSDKPPGAFLNNQKETDAAPNWFPSNSFLISSAGHIQGAAYAHQDIYFAFSSFHACDGNR
jgi:hypothetical protein